MTRANPRLERKIEQAIPRTELATRRHLAATGRIRSVEIEGTVFHQDQVIPMVLVLEGYGAYVRTTADGRQLALGIAEPGLVHAFSAISGVRSRVELVAWTSCEVATWNGDDVRPLVASDPAFALAVIDHQSATMNNLTEKVDGFVHQNARRRVVRVLVRHHELFFGAQPVLSRSHLPALVGTSREMTSRVLRELENDGVVARVGRNGLRLLRPQGLADEQST
jgi:CRP-like cAMP-binding protein